MVLSLRFSFNLFILYAEESVFVYVHRLFCPIINGEKAAAVFQQMQKTEKYSLQASIFRV